MSTAELYNPATGTFTATSTSMVGQHDNYHAATRLGNGKVLITGGVGISPSTGGIRSNADLYDPIADTLVAAHGQERLYGWAAGLGLF